MFNVVCITYLLDGHASSACWQFLKGAVCMFGYVSVCSIGLNFC